MTSVHRRIRREGAVSLLAALALTLPAAVAHAAPVLIMSPGGHVTRAQDPFLPAGEPTPTPNTIGATTAAARPTKRRKPPQKTVASELVRLRNSGAITAAQYAAYNASFNAALAAAMLWRLVITASSSEARVPPRWRSAAGKLTPARLPVLFQTLDNNRQWWTSGPIPAAGSYVEFAGSQLVWEYYAGQGIELQVLGTFGKADGLYTGGPGNYPQLEALLAQMIPLAVNRGGGQPPWTSAMSQGTGIEALTRAYLASHDPNYLLLAHQAVLVFTAPPPVGVRVNTPVGARYVQYTFTPGTSILNAFLQSLIGLYDYAQTSGDPLAEQLFAAGNAEAQAEVPQFDTGAWSLYQPGVEDTVSYHQLVTGFLQQLCQRTQVPVYCVAGQHFTAYMTTPPALTLITQQAPKNKPVTIQFNLSKYSHVGIVVVGPGGHTLFETSGNFGYGTRSFAVPALKHKGTYTISLAATDLAGNFSRIVGTIQVS